MVSIMRDDTLVETETSHGQSAAAGSDDQRHGILLDSFR